MSSENIFSRPILTNRIDFDKAVADEPMRSGRASLDTVTAGDFVFFETQSTGMRFDQVRLVRVLRTTATLIILGDGSRWRRSGGYPQGSGIYKHRRRISPVNGQQIDRFRARFDEREAKLLREEAVEKVRRLVDIFVQSLTVTELTELADTVESALRRTGVVEE